MNLRKTILWITALTGATVFLYSLAAQEEKAGAPQAGEEVEELEDITEVAPVKTPAEPTFIETIGRFHPAIVHFPIAWITLLVLLDFMGFAKGSLECRKWGIYILGLTVISAIPAVFTGFLRGGVVEQVPEIHGLVEAHEAVMLSFTVVTAIAFAVRLSRKNELTGAYKLIYLALLGIAGLLVMIGGHLGGKLVFGPDYLPF
ncbi:MAG: hypothetical protein PHQ00_05925 [Phycisphaerae bacterium]|nr:hypothetical protein [Phycisphaerae bacterium]